MVESLSIYDVMNMVSNKVFSLSQVDSGFPNVSLEKLGSTFITKFRDVLVRPKARQSTHRSRFFRFYTIKVDRPRVEDHHESYRSKFSACDGISRIFKTISITFCYSEVIYA